LIASGTENSGKRALPGAPSSDSSDTAGLALRAAIFDLLLPAIGKHKQLLLAPETT